MLGTNSNDFIGNVNEFNTKRILRMPKVLTNKYIVIVFIIYSITKLAYTQTDVIYIQNLNAQCLRCLCHAATNCDLTLNCNAGYCGAYKISRVYWIDTGRLVMPEDDPERAGSFEDCALHYNCAQRMVINYMAKYGRDCNGDGVTNCDDFSMIHFNGGFQCSPPLNRNEAGRNWTSRYRTCAPT